MQFSSFDVFGSILLVQYAVIGGLGWISGVVLGASAAPGAIATRITNDLLPNLDNVAAWIAIFSAIGVVQLLRRAPGRRGIDVGEDRHALHPPSRRHRRRNRLRVAAPRTSD